MHPAYFDGYAMVLTKLAAITEEDIAAALAGNKSREISPEEIQEFARQRQLEAQADAGGRPALGTGLGAGIGGSLGAFLGRFRSLMWHRGSPRTRSTLVGAGIGALAGSGLGRGIGALSKHISGVGAREWGSTLGHIAREGKVPRVMPYRKHQDLIPYAKGIQARPLTPAEFAAIRTSLGNEYAREGAAEEGLTSAWTGKNTDDLQHMEILEGLRTARPARHRAGTFADLYERGYGHLAGRLYEGQ